MVRSIQRYWIAGLISMVLLMNGFIVYNALKERNEFEQLNKKQQTQLFSLKSKIEKLENEKPTQPQSSIQLIKSKILIAIKTGKNTINYFVIIIIFIYLFLSLLFIFLFFL